MVLLETAPEALRSCSRITASISFRSRTWNASVSTSSADSMSPSSVGVDALHHHELLVLFVKRRTPTRGFS